MSLQSIGVLLLLATVGVGAGALTMRWYMRSRPWLVDDGGMHRTRYWTRLLGSIYCNYVDVHALRGLATELGVEPSPDRVEKQSSKRRRRGASASTGGASARIDAEQFTGRTEHFDLPFDPNQLTAEVLRSLLESGSINQDLAIASTGSPAQWAPLIEILPEAAERGIVTAELEGQLRELAGDALLGEKTQEFVGVVEDGPYVLVDATWHVLHPEGNKIVLELSEFLAPPREKIPVPVGLGIVVTLDFTEVGFSDGAGMTPRGAARLKGDSTTVAAVVLGSPESLEGGVLRLTPIVVYDRVGGRRLDPYELGT